MLSLDIWQHCVIGYLRYKDQDKLIKCISNLEYTDLVCDESTTDDDLKKYKYMKRLDISSTDVTADSISHMCLNELITNKNITNIKYMSCNTLILGDRKDDKIYWIKDNGACPYYVHVTNDIITINTRESHLVAYLSKYEKIFIGKNNGFEDGNCILIKLDNRYIHVGLEIYQFETDDEILDFYSEVGNHSVSYPVAVGKKYAYFMLDRKYLSKEHFHLDADWATAYSAYYMLEKHVQPIPMKYKKLHGDTIGINKN
jgi:hypothetical protein